MRLAPYMRRMISYSPPGMRFDTKFASPTCFPALQPPGCPVDNALQLGSDITGAPLTRTVDGESRSYLTTPPSCPEAGHWETPIRFWWADVSVDTVVTRQPCTPGSA